MIPKKIKRNKQKCLQRKIKNNFWLLFQRTSAGIRGYFEKQKLLSCFLES